MEDGPWHEIESHDGLREVEQLQRIADGFKTRAANEHAIESSDYFETNRETPIQVLNMIGNIVKSSQTSDLWSFRVPVSLLKCIYQFASDRLLTASQDSIL